MKIQTKLLHPHPRNSEFFDDITGEPWQEFLKSVETSGVIQPVVITQDNVVVSGHQRLRACQELGIAEIPVVQRTYADEDAVLKDLLETNIRQRGVDNSNPVKLGRCIKELERLYEIGHGGNHGNQYTKLASPNNSDLATQPPEKKMTQSQLASQIGMSVDTLNNLKKLAALIPEWEEFLETGVITPTTALGVARQLTSDDQREFLSRLDKETKYSASMTQPLVDEIKQLKSAPPKVVKDEETARKLSEATRQHAEDARVIKGLRSSEETSRRRADEAERKLSSVTSDLQSQIDDLNRQLDEAYSRLAEKLTPPPEGYYDELAYAKQEIDELNTLNYQIQQMLEILAPLKFRQSLYGIDHKSGSRKITEDLVHRVNTWVIEMAKVLSIEVDYIDI